MMTRSASPSSAMPRFAPVRFTSACNVCGCVAPTPSLMLKPSGLAPMDTTSAPSSWNTHGAIWYAAPCAESTTMRMPFKSRRVGNVLLQNSM
jgi:hypothetical protein